MFQSFTDNGVHNHAIEIIEVHGDGDFAYAVARWSAEGAEKDGEKPAFGGILVNVFYRGDDGDWKSQSHVWNAAD